MLKTNLPKQHLENEMVIDQNLGEVINLRFSDRFQEDKYVKKFKDGVRYDLSGIDKYQFYKDRSETFMVLRRQKNKMLNQIYKKICGLPYEDQKQAIIEYNKSLKFYLHRNCPTGQLPLQMNAQENTGVAYWIRRHKDRIRKYKIGVKQHWKNLTMNEKVNQKNELTQTFLRELGHQI